MMRFVLVVFFLLPVSKAGTYRLLSYTNELRAGTLIYYYDHADTLLNIEEFYGKVEPGFSPDQRYFAIATNLISKSIPAPIQMVASSYKAAFEGIYGQGSVTNRALTREYVAIDLSLRNDISADTGLRLSTWFDILNGYWGRGEVWTYPWGQTNYEAETYQELWEAVP